jgi:hypothetical protein
MVKFIFKKAIVCCTQREEGRGLVRNFGNRYLEEIYSVNVDTAISIQTYLLLPFVTNTYVTTDSHREACVSL